MTMEVWKMSGVGGLPQWGVPNQKNLQGYYIRDEHGELDAPHERINDEYPRNSFQEQSQRQSHAQGYGSFQQPRQACYGQAGLSVQTAYPMQPERPKTPRTLAKEAYERAKLEGKSIKEATDYASAVRYKERYNSLKANGVSAKVAQNSRASQEKYERALRDAQSKSRSS